MFKRSISRILIALKVYSSIFSSLQATLADHYRFDDSIHLQAFPYSADQTRGYLPDPQLIIQLGTHTASDSDTDQPSAIRLLDEFAVPLRKSPVSPISKEASTEEPFERDQSDDTPTSDCSPSNAETLTPLGSDNLGFFDPIDLALQERGMYRTPEGMETTIDGLRLVITQDGHMVLSGKRTNPSKKLVLHAPRTFTLDSVEGGQLEIRAPLVLNTGNSALDYLSVIGVVDADDLSGAPKFINRGSLTAKEAFLDGLQIENEATFDLGTVTLKDCKNSTNQGTWKSAKLSGSLSEIENHGTVAWQDASSLAVATFKNVAIASIDTLTTTGGIENSGTWRSKQLSVQGGGVGAGALDNQGKFYLEQMAQAPASSTSSSASSSTRSFINSLTNSGEFVGNGSLAVATGSNTGTLITSSLDIQTSFTNSSNAVLETTSLSGTGVLENHGILGTHPQAEVVDLKNLELAIRQLTNHGPGMIKAKSVSGQESLEKLDNLGRAEISEKFALSPVTQLINQGFLKAQQFSAGVVELLGTMVTREFQGSGMISPTGKLFTKSAVFQEEMTVLGTVEADTLTAAKGLIVNGKLEVKRLATVDGALSVGVEGVLSGLQGHQLTLDLKGTAEIAGIVDADILTAAKAITVADQGQLLTQQSTTLTEDLTIAKGGTAQLKALKIDGITVANQGQFTVSGITTGDAGLTLINSSNALIDGEQILPRASERVSEHDPQNTAEIKLVSALDAAFLALIGAPRNTQATAAELEMVQQQIEGIPLNPVLDQANGRAFYSSADDLAEPGEAQEIVITSIGRARYRDLGAAILELQRRSAGSDFIATKLLEIMSAGNTTAMHVLVAEYNTQLALHKLLKADTCKDDQTINDLTLESLQAIAKLPVASHAQALSTLRERLAQVAPTYLGRIGFADGSGPSAFGKLRTGMLSGIDNLLQRLRQASALASGTAKLKLDNQVSGQLTLKSGQFDFIGDAALSNDGTLLQEQACLQWVTGSPREFNRGTWTVKGSLSLKDYTAEALSNLNVEGALHVATTEDAIQALRALSGVKAQKIIMRAASAVFKEDCTYYWPLKLELTGLMQVNATCKAPGFEVKAGLFTTAGGNYGSLIATNGALDVRVDHFENPNGKLFGKTSTYVEGKKFFKNGDRRDRPGAATGTIQYERNESGIFSEEGDLTVYSQAADIVNYYGEINSINGKIFVQTDKEDGEFVSTAGFVHSKTGGVIKAKTIRVIRDGPNYYLSGCHKYKKLFHVFDHHNGCSPIRSNYYETSDQSMLWVENGELHLTYQYLEIIASQITSGLDVLMHYQSTWGTSGASGTITGEFVAGSSAPDVQGTVIDPRYAAFAGIKARHDLRGEMGEANISGLLSSGGSMVLQALKLALQSAKLTDRRDNAGVAIRFIEGLRQGAANNRLLTFTADGTVDSALPLSTESKEFGIVGPQPQSFRADQARMAATPAALRQYLMPVLPSIIKCLDHCNLSVDDLFDNGVRAIKQQRDQKRLTAGRTANSSSSSADDDTVTIDEMIASDSLMLVWEVAKNYEQIESDARILSQQQQHEGGAYRLEPVLIRPSQAAEKSSAGMHSKGLLEVDV